jgi:predicted RNA-binding Zn-ribbon protein involved in translation (DUF1610 family)
MVTGTLLTALLPLAIIIVALVAVLVAGKGKQLKCPDCGTVFSPPAMDQKRSGLGWTLPFMGNVKCPTCGESRGRRDYQKVPSPNKTT